MRLGEMTWTQAREVVEAGVTAVLPLGSLEEHGPHNVMGDYLAYDKITAAATEETGDVMAPVMPFGYSEYFRNYAGTITMRASTLGAVVTDATAYVLCDRAPASASLPNSGKGSSRPDLPFAPGPTA
jgi:creatinine amidohydrolase/Fe(II)-dependent formamide hydrolase-like protein